MDSELINGLMQWIGTMPTSVSNAVWFVIVLYLTNRLGIITRRRKTKKGKGGSDDSEDHTDVVGGLLQGILGKGGGGGGECKATACKASACGFNGRETAALNEIKTASLEMRTLATVTNNHLENVADGLGELQKIQSETLGVMKGEIYAQGRKARAALRRKKATGSGKRGARSGKKVKR